MRTLRWIMLDERKVKLMTRLALYEQTQGKEDFKISEYYRKDYAGMHILLSFFWTTFGYVCVAALVVLAGFQELLAKMSLNFVIMLGAAAVAGYVALIILYSIITSHIYNKRHRNARQRVKRYNHDLTKLLRMYEKEKR